MILSLQSIRHVEGRGLEIVFFSSYQNELVHRLNLLHQEKTAGKDSKSINDEIIAIVDKLFENDCLPKEEHASFIKKRLCEVLKNYIYFNFRYNYNTFLHHLIY